MAHNSQEYKMSAKIGYILAVLLLFLTHTAYAGGGRFTPESQAEILSRALSNPEIVVGVYNYPSKEEYGPDWYNLKDGTSALDYNTRLM